MNISLGKTFEWVDIKDSDHLSFAIFNESCNPDEEGRVQPSAKTENSLQAPTGLEEQYLIAGVTIHSSLIETVKGKEISVYCLQGVPLTFLEKQKILYMMADGVMADCGPIPMF